MPSKEKVVIVGGGPVGSLAALYAAQRGYEVEIYELRNGASFLSSEEAAHDPRCQFTCFYFIFCSI